MNYQQNLKRCFSHSVVLHHLIFLLHVPFFPQSGALKTHKQLPSSSSVAAILVFGDSTVDPGNNNFIPTAFRGNFPPYGKDFLNQIPTGRFSNGRLSTDFIASYLGVKEYVPPYLDPKLSIEELMTGVSFASAGSGFDPLTPQIGNVLPISSQLEYFKEYKKKLESAIGKQRTETHIKNTVFFISCGTNDFVLNYYTFPIRRKSFTISTYQQFIIQQIRQLFQALWDEGARRFAMPGLSPMGCLPIVITMFSGDAILQRACLDQYSSTARAFNGLLQAELLSMQTRFSKKSSTLMGYINSYDCMNDMIHNVQKYGLEKVDIGCCGSGFMETSFMCNFKSFMCPDVTKYLFWDSIHPTETGYYFLFKAGIPALDYITKDLH